MQEYLPLKAKMRGGEEGEGKMKNEKCKMKIKVPRSLQWID